jgi:hypothetical protein
MLIFPKRCPDTLANPLLGALRAEAPDIHTSSEGQAHGPDEMLVLDDSEFACFLRIYEKYKSAKTSNRDDIITFDMSKCPK